MVKPWIGGRRIGFVPVSNSAVDTSLPNDFEELALQRAFFDPDPASGVDRSLQAYIRTVSSGRAHIDGGMLPPVVSDGDDTMGAAIFSLPANHNLDCVVAVLPHASGPHRGGFAWWDSPEQNGITDFARVALFTNSTFSVSQNLGVWAMEVLHAVTHFGDLYNVSPQPGRFDVMACACATHPSSHTKAWMGWLHHFALQTHPIGSTRSYTLHAASLPQPPPGRLTVVKVNSQVSPGHFLIEARLRTDIYESTGLQSVGAGIPAEGVVVYEDRGVTEVYLLASGMGLGDVFEEPDEKLTVRVTGEVDSGFRVSVTSGEPDRCSQLEKQIAVLRADIDLETDIHIRKQLISALLEAISEFRGLNCARFPVVLADLLEPSTDKAYEQP